MNLDPAPIMLLHDLVLVPDGVQVGRLVRRTAQPHQDFCDVLDHIIPSTAIIKGSLTNFSASIESTTSSTIVGRLTKLFSSSRQNSEEKSINLNAKTVFTYQLKNSRTWFLEAIKYHETRVWVEEAIKDGVDIYFVVGYHTIKDIQVSQFNEKKSTVAGDASVTPEDIMGASNIFTSTIPGSSELLSVGLHGSRSATSQNNLRYSIPTSDCESEHAFGIQYRKIKFSWLSSKTTDKAKLEEGHRWKMMWSMRGEENVVNDVVELGLDESAKEDESFAESLEVDKGVWYILGDESGDSACDQGSESEDEFEEELEEEDD